MVEVRTIRLATTRNNDINKKDDDEFFIAVTIGCNGRTTTGWPNIDDEETSGCARR